MDKYEYRVKTEQMLEYVEKKSYGKAMEIADTIDWRRIKNTSMLTSVSEIYENVGEYRKAKDILFIAYDKAPGSRKTVYHLGLLALKTGDTSEAMDCYEEFVKLAPKDPNQYILRYKILKAQGAALEQQIEALEEFKHAEYVEKWAFELARLYHEAGMTEECLEECDDLILWFSEGKYVYQAMELKMKYKPLTPLQQEKYDSRVTDKTEAVRKKPMFKKPKERPVPDPRISRKIRENVHVTGSIDLPELPEPTGNTIEAELESLPDERPQSSRPRTKIESTSDIMTTITGANLADVLKAGVAVASGVDPKEVSGGEDHQVTGQMRIEEILAGWEETQRENARIIEKNQEEVNRKKAKRKKEESTSGDTKTILPDDIRKLMEELESGVEPSDDVDSSLDEEPEESFEQEDELDFENMGSVVESLQLSDDDEYDDDSEYEEEDEDDSEYDEEEDEYEDDSEYDEEEDEYEEDSEYDGEEDKYEDDSEYDEEEDEYEDDSEYDEEEDEYEEDSEYDGEEDKYEDDSEYDEEEDEYEEDSEEEAEYEDDSEYEDEEDEEYEGDSEEEAEYEDDSEYEDEEYEEDSEEEAEYEEDSEYEDEEYEDDSEEEEFNEDSEAEEDEQESEFIDAKYESDSEWNINFKDELGALSEAFEDGAESVEISGIEFDDELEEDNVADEEDIFAGVFNDVDEEYEEGSEEEDEYEDEEYEEDFEEEDEYEEEEYEEDFEEEDEYEEEEYEEDFEEEDEYEEEEYEEDFEEEDEYEEEEYEEEEYEEDFEEEDEYEEEEYEEDFEEEDAYEEDDEYLEAEPLPEPEPEPVPVKKPKKAKKSAVKKEEVLEIEEPSEAEITARMEKFDTGFVVQGRYDLSATSEIGLRMGLTEEQKKLFSYFVPIRGVSEQIVEILNRDKHCKNRYGTSRTGNIVVVGRKGSGKTVLAVDLVKAIQKQRKLKQGRVAIVTGESLNKKELTGIIDKLQGGALIIEKAAKMNTRTIRELNELMEEQTGEMLFVLEEQRKPLERMFAANPKFKKKFTSRMELPVFINDELVTFGQTYAKENGYRIDEMGILALYSRIDMMQREDHAVTVAEVKEIMDEAIEHSQKANVKHLVKRVFGKSTDESDRIILKEEDFKL